MSELPVVPRSLAKKLSELYAVVERVPKNGHNSFHGYDYATEADIVSAVRLAMADRGIVMIPYVAETKLEPLLTNSGKKEWLCTLTVDFVLRDDSDKTFTVRVVGQGQDPGDKAAYKAMTGAVKYALLKLFLIPTGDDPEADEKPAPSSPATVAATRSEDPRPSPPRDVSSHAGQPADAKCPGYGRDKEKMLSQIDLKSLEFYEGGCLKTLADESKARFHDKEKGLLKLIRAWKEYRDPDAAASRSAGPQF